MLTKEQIQEKLDETYDILAKKLGNKLDGAMFIMVHVGKDDMPARKDMEGYPLVQEVPKHSVTYFQGRGWTKLTRSTPPIEAKPARGRKKKVEA